VNAGVFDGMELLTKQQPIHRHVVDEAIRVERIGRQERIPVERLRVRAPAPGLAIRREPAPIDDFGKAALDRMVMRLERRAELLGRHAGDEAAAALARDQQLAAVLE
jgi:hypothetical protein